MKAFIFKIGIGLLLTVLFTNLNAQTTVSHLTPNSGSPYGYEYFYIIGSGFTSASDVKFGDESVLWFKVISDTEINAISLPGSGSKKLHVTVDGVDYGNLDFYYRSPVIKRIGVDEAHGGELMVITGENFSNFTEVYFGTNKAEVISLIYGGMFDDELYLLIPPGQGTVRMFAVSPEGTSNSYEFTHLNPTIQFNTTSSSGLESINNVNIQVEISYMSYYMGSSVDYTITGTASGNGEDYTLVSGTLNIPKEQTVGTITIANIVDDLIFEGDETVELTLSNPVNAVLGTNTQYTYTIQDNDVFTATEKKTDSGMSVYPNPFKGTVRLNGVKENMSKVSVINNEGKTIMVINYNGEQVLDLGHLSSGTYILVFNSDNGEKQKMRIMKE